MAAHANRSGFSLMELMIVIMIIGLLAGLVGPAVNNALKKAKKRTTKTTLLTIKKAITEYQGDINQLPGTLKDLIKKPRDEKAAKKWESAYLGDGLEDVPGDAWDNKFHYKLTPGGKHPYELLSYGPSGKGSDKSEWISVWDEN